MDRVLTDCEFFTYEEEVWLRTSDGAVRKLSEKDYDLIGDLCDFIATFYPKAYAALAEEYKGSALNQPYYRFRIAARFIRCNFSELDNVPDIRPDMHCNFEYVKCPLRGECRHDGVICRPEFNHRMSPAEHQVLALLYENLSEDEIGKHLFLSPHTVHTHIRNAFARIGLHSRAEFIKYAAQNKIFS